MNFSNDKIITKEKYSLSQGQPQNQALYKKLYLVNESNRQRRAFRD